MLMSKNNDDTVFMLQQTYKSMDWMIKSLTHDKNEGTYSDELKVAILCREWMQQFEDNKNKI